MKKTERELNEFETFLCKRMHFTLTYQLDSSSCLADTKRGVIGRHVVLSIEIVTGVQDFSIIDLTCPCFKIHRFMFH